MNTIQNNEILCGIQHLSDVFAGKDFEVKVWSIHDDREGKYLN